MPLEPGRQHTQGTCHQSQSWSFKVLIACLFFIFCHTSPFSPSALCIRQQKPCLFLPNHDSRPPAADWSTHGSNTLDFFLRSYTQSSSHPIPLPPHVHIHPFLCSTTQLSSLPLCTWCGSHLHQDGARGSVRPASEYLVLDKICYLNKYKLCFLFVCLFALKIGFSVVQAGLKTVKYPFLPVATH